MDSVVYILIILSLIFILWRIFGKPWLDKGVKKYEACQHKKLSVRKSYDYEDNITLVYYCLQCGKVISRNEQTAVTFDRKDTEKLAKELREHTGGGDKP